MKKLLVVLVTISMLLGLMTGCSKPKEKPTERPATSSYENNSLTLGINARLNTLDPYHYTLNNESGIINTIYNTLYKLDASNNPVLELAEKMTLAEDGSYVEFTLKSGVKFANGEDLTVEDVEYSILRGAKSATVVYVATYTTFEKIDDLTFRLNFLAPAQAGFAALASYIDKVAVVSKAYCEAKGYGVDDDMLFDCNGTGSFMLDSINEASGDVTLKKNPNAFKVASLDSVTYKVITGDMQLAFEAGEIDICGYNATQFKNIEGLTNIGYKYDVRNYSAFLIFNCTEKYPANNKDVRLGLAYALNRNDIATAATNGTGETLYNLANPAVSGYGDVCEHYDRDLEKSKQLLASAGYSAEHPYEIELVVMGIQPDWVTACEVIKKNLEESYCKVTITQLADTNRYFNHDYDMGLLGITLTTSIVSYSMMFDPTQFNLAGLPEEEAKPIREACITATTDEAAQEVMKMMVDSMAYYPLYFGSSYTVFDSRLDVSASYDQFKGIILNEVSWKK